MNLAQLSYFIAVVEEGSFTRGAQRAHVAQSSLSQQVRQLESELGGPLIERLPRSIRLTQAGRAFLPEARASLNAAERAARNARAVLRLDGGELEIATVRSVVVGILLESIKRWHQLHSEIPIRLHEYDNRLLLEEAFRTGVGDLAFGPRPADWSGPLKPIGFEEFVVVLPAGDPLLQEPGPVGLRRLADRDWVLFPPHHGFTAITLEACAAAGFEPTVALRTTQNDAAARYAAAGIGPTVVAGNIVPADLQSCVRPIDPPVVRELVAYTRTQWEPHTRAYLELVDEQRPAHPPPGATVI